MRLCSRLLPIDEILVRRELVDFVPAEIFDIHAHLVADAPDLPSHLREAELGVDAYHTALSRWLPGRRRGALFFGFPSRNNDRRRINQRLRDEIRNPADGEVRRGLILVAPQDDRNEIRERLQEREFVGLKPYHCYAALADTSQARVEDFAPQWMWEMCHQTNSILMLHIMRDAAVADEDNIASLQRLCRDFPRCRLILAHIARSFSYRKARKGLDRICDMENVWVDTSAITEAETFRCALRIFGPKRILFGTDYPISELRGRCVATADTFSWFYAPDASAEGVEKDHGMTLIGIESLLCLREAAEDFGLTPTNVRDIFCENARRLLTLP